MRTVGILDYGAGNLTSVRLAFERIGARVRFITSREAAEFCDALVFPGVGSAASGMAGLCSRKLDQVLRRTLSTGKPVLSICLGMQMLFDRSEEDGGVDGLGILSGSIRRFRFPEEQRVKIPQMGWNCVHYAKSHPLWRGIPQDSAFYFVHSYYVQAEQNADVAGTTEYAGFSFCSAAARGNLFATQFHPERSGMAGLRLLENFLAWNGEGEGKTCC